jgi:hypothetical protein
MPGEISAPAMSVAAAQPPMPQLSRRISATPIVKCLRIDLRIQRGSFSLTSCMSLHQTKNRF